MKNKPHKFKVGDQVKVVQWLTEMWDYSSPTGIIIAEQTPKWNSAGYPLYTVNHGSEPLSESGFSEEWFELDDQAVKTTTSQPSEVWFIDVLKNADDLGKLKVIHWLQTNKAENVVAALMGAVESTG